jgi:plastocyanin
VRLKPKRKPALTPKLRLMPMPLRVWLGALALTGLATACGGTDATVPDLPEMPRAPAGPTGQLRGVVRLDGEAPAAAVDPITENQDTCGESALLPRLVVDDDNGVQHAFVFLEGVESAGASAPGEAALIDQQRCRYVPHTMTVLTGTELEITNSDPILHNVHGTAVVGEQNGRTVFNVAQPRQGVRTRIDDALAEPGMVHLTCQAGHPWMSAWILVSDHPYTAVTDSSGGFLIENVPVGTYTIKMWHEGVHLTRIVRSLQRYDYEDPYEVSREVTVTEGVETVVNFDLTLRPRPE